MFNLSDNSGIGFYLPAAEVEAISISGQILLVFDILFIYLKVFRFRHRSRQLRVVQMRLYSVVLVKLKALRIFLSSSFVIVSFLRIEKSPFWA